MERAEQAVFDFKEKGKDALASAVKGMHLTQGLQKLQSSLHTVMLSMDQKIDRLGSMAEELQVAKGHLKNAFLEIWCSFFIRYGHKKHPIKSFPLGRGVVRIASS